MVTKKGCALGLVVPVFVCLAMTTLYVVPRVWPMRRTPPVPTSDLMLDISAFPENWWSSGAPADFIVRLHGERECVQAQFFPEGSDRRIYGAYHRVFRYRNEVDALYIYYLDFYGGEFLPWHMVTQWAVPEEWSYESPVADRLKFACGEVDMSPLGPPRWECEAVAQYDEYVSVFHTELDPDYMTLQDVERILVSIDERMALYLWRHTQ